MSTATVAAVRPLSAIKADAANFLANKPESLLADAKAALTWLPRKAYNAAMRALRWLHVPQFLSFARRNFMKFIGIVGKGPFAVEMLTSHWGQKTIVKGVEIGGKVVGFAVKWSWKILTSPLRLFSPTRKGVEKVETAIAKVNDKLTPNSGETFGPLQITRDLAAYNLSADRTHMKFARTTAVAVMAVRLTRRFTPVGWMRVAAYIIDGLIIARSYGEVLENTWIGKKIAGQAAIIEADVLRQGETVIAEATHLNRDAAEKTAANLRQQAAAMEAEGIEAAEQLSKDLVAQTAENAEELRQQASALEASAERLAAAETAAAVTEEVQEASTVLVEERPKPGPSVPPMGGRTPSNGPQGQQHGPSGKNKGRNR